MSTCHYDGTIWMSRRLPLRKEQVNLVPSTAESLAVAVSAQTVSVEAKKISPEKSVGRDPFKKYEAAYKPGCEPAKLRAPRMEPEVEHPQPAGDEQDAR